MTAQENRRIVRQEDNPSQPGPAQPHTRQKWRNQHRCNLMIVAFTLSSFVLGGIFFHGRSGLAAQGGNPMNVTRITIDHVRVVADKPFDKVTKAFEQQLGQFDPEVYKSLAAGEDAEKVRAKIEAMVGPSGFMLFRTSDHGALLRLAGQKKKASSISSAIRCSPCR